MSPQRLRIAYVVARYGRRFGGAEAYGVDLMQQLALHHDVTVVSSEYDEPGSTLPQLCVPPPSSHWPSWIKVALFARRARRLTENRFDIVHSHVNGGGWDVDVVHVTPVRYNLFLRPRPVLKRMLTYLSPRLLTYLHLEASRIAARPMHRVVAVSALTRDQLQQAYGTDQDYPIIPPGVHPPTPVSTEQRAELRATLGYGPADCVLLMVARDPWRKGLPTALRALATLPPHIKLMVIGAESQCAVQMRADPSFQETLAPRVQLIAPSPVIDHYYQAADICIHPTRNDSFGMAPLEAMAHGLPVIVSPMPYCGFSHYLEHGRHALLLNRPNDAAQLAHFIVQLEQDPVLRQHLQDHAQIVVRQHDWAVLAERYQGLYDALLKERSDGQARPPHRKSWLSRLRVPARSLPDSRLPH